jgi:hypothetical protein
MLPQNRTSPLSFQSNFFSTETMSTTLQSWRKLKEMAQQVYLK